MKIFWSHSVDVRSVNRLDPLDLHHLVYQLGQVLISHQGYLETNTKKISSHIWASHLVPSSGTCCKLGRKIYCTCANPALWLSTTHAVLRRWGSFQHHLPTDTHINITVASVVYLFFNLWSIFRPNHMKVTRFNHAKIWITERLTKSDSKFPNYIWAHLGTYLFYLLFLLSWWDQLFIPMLIDFVQHLSKTQY